MMTSLRSKWAAGKAVRAGLAVRGRISRAIRSRRAAQPPAHFHRNPQGRGQLAVFPRCSLLMYRFRCDRRSRLEKQPTDLRRKAYLFWEQDTNNGSLFCRAPDRSSDLRDDEEEWASIYGRFCPRGASNLPCPDLVLQDESEPCSRGDCERIAAGAHADFDCVWRDLFLCRAGTLRRHGDTPAVARRCFTQSG